MDEEKVLALVASLRGHALEIMNDEEKGITKT